MEKTKVMIVDDSRVARELFEMYIKNSDNFLWIKHSKL